MSTTPFAAWVQVTTTVSASGWATDPVVCPPSRLKVRFWSTVASQTQQLGFRRVIVAPLTAPEVLAWTSKPTKSRTATMPFVPFASTGLLVKE